MCLLSHTPGTLWTTCFVPGVLQIDKSIIGWDSTVGAWCRLENHCVLGEDVQVKVRGVTPGFVPHMRQQH
jgi:NDP-sugar pyrophosphorylase family protein